MIPEKLINLAMEAMKKAYAPYSGFQVGAALLCSDGTVFTGCNIENAAYGPTNCAERTAVFKAVSEGQRRFRRIAIAADTEQFCAPCGVCRQVLREFDPELKLEIILVNRDGETRDFTLAELFPHSFGSSNLT